MGVHQDIGVVGFLIGMGQWRDMREVVCTIVLDASARHDVEVDVRDFLAGVFACIIKQILQISRLGLAMEWNLGKIFVFG